MDAYLARLDAVGRAMTMAQDAYASALAERDELRLMLGAYGAKAADQRTSPRSHAGRRRPRGPRATGRRVARAGARRPGPGARAGRRLRGLPGQCPGAAPPLTPRRRRPTMSPTACAQPGCTGAILDGYCDVCGSPGPGQVHPGEQPRPSAVRPAGARSRGARARWSTGTATSAGRPARRVRLPDRAGRRRELRHRCLGRDDAGRPGPVAVDGLAGVQPARLDRPRLGPCDRRRQQGHPTGRHVLDPAARAPGSAPG